MALDALLKSHEDRLVDAWVGIAAQALRGRLTEAELRRQLGEIYSALLVAIGDRPFDLASEPASELRAVLGELSSSRARNGFTPTETATSVLSLKDAVLSVVDLGAADRREFDDVIALTAVVDQLALFTFDIYSRTREGLISEQTEQLLELSTPVVKLWEGVVAVPLVGTLDSARAQVVMEKLLQTLVDTGSAFAIIDITGVPAVDTQVAQHILKTVVAARLMGAECVISGIRPQIAQTIVALGIEFGDIATKATLADALVHALRAAGVEMVRKRS